MTTALHQEKDITVFIVDDSSYMRSMMSDIVAKTGGMRCIGTAADPLEARQKIKDTNPDVLTLDIEMPGMSGLEFLEKVMRLRPMPVIMVSSLTRRGADATVQALATGAVDCVAKPENPEHMSAFRRDVTEKIRIAAGAAMRRVPVRPATTHIPAVPRANKGRKDMIAIGASTGGVEALSTLLPALGAGLPPIVIAQHMPAMFTASLAQRLNTLCEANVKEAEHGDRLAQGYIYIAQGGKQCRVVSDAGSYRLDTKDTGRVSGHCPSVDALFASVASAAGIRAAGVILTGMGNDGAEGLTTMRNTGCPTFGQDEATSLIYGMPRAAFNAGAVEHQLPLEYIASAVRNACC